MQLSTYSAAAAAAGTTLSALVNPAIASTTAQPANFLINITIADMNVFSTMQPVDPNNTTSLMAALEQYGMEPGIHGVNWTVEPAETAMSTTFKENISHDCLMKCLATCWWGPLVYAL